MKQFGRHYELVIGSATDGFTFNNLRINFTVTKSLDKNPNAGRIKVYNLTMAHIDAILSGQYDKVALSVGYNALRLIYAGNIAQAVATTEGGTDHIVEMQTGDGNADFLGARVNMVLPAGTTDAQAAVALAGTLPTTTRGTMAVQRTEGLSRARVYCGSTRDYLTNLARANSADWSIQDGELVMLPYNAAIAGTGPLISQETGMVNSPGVRMSHHEEHKESAKGEGQGSARRGGKHHGRQRGGLEVTCLLNPEIIVGGLVRVQSIFKHYNGDYKVVSVEHSGDNAEGDWQSKLTCVGGIFQLVSKDKATGVSAGSGEVDEGDYDPEDLEPVMGPRVWSVEELIHDERWQLPRRVGRV